MRTKEEVKEAANGILDVMSAADGGGQFTRFWHGTLASILEGIETEEGQRLADLIIHFNRLVQIRPK